MNTVVGIVNQSTCVKDADVAAYLSALQTQVTRDLAPAWSLPATDVNFIVDRTAPIPKDWWVLGIFDDTTQLGALGFHDTTPTGLPLGKCFAGTDLKYGEDWRITFSHELCEMLVDPQCKRSMLTAFNGNMVFAAVEVCDPCEDERWAYQIDNMPVSDFVTPLFYAASPTGPYDHAAHIAQPMQLLEGGYLSTLDPRAGTGWVQTFGEYVPQHKKWPLLGSRRERRALDPSRLRPSTFAIA